MDCITLKKSSPLLHVFWKEFQSIKEILMLWRYWNVKLANSKIWRWQQRDHLTSTYTIKTRSSASLVQCNRFEVLSWLKTCVKWLSSNKSHAFVTQSNVCNVWFQYLFYFSKWVIKAFVKLSTFWFHQHLASSLLNSRAYPSFVDVDFYSTKQLLLNKLASPTFVVLSLCCNLQILLINV